MIDYTTEYAREVYKGDVLASFLVKKQCERHLKDMKGLSGYTFHPDKANKVIKFIEMLPDIKTGERIQLADFQKFIVGSLYGWRDELGNRRFNKAYISMARKNGKSILVAGIALYEFLFGRNPKLGRQIYCTANAKDQAKIVWTMVRKQLEKLRATSAAVKGISKITESKNEILNVKDDSLIKPLSKDTSNLDGFEPYVGILDEFHESKDTKTMEVLESGMIQQQNPLTIIISTVGFYLNGPMYKEYLYVKKMLSGAEENDNYFAFVAEMDSVIEVHDEEKWIKANPLLAVDELRDLLMRNLRKKYKEAVQKDDLVGTFVKNFNLWQSAGEDSYLKGADWEACKTLLDFNPRGREVYIGLDLSRLDDLTAIGLIFPTENEKFYVDAHVFVGTKGGIQAKSDRDKIDYQALVQTDYATLTNSDSGIINYKQVISWIVNFIENNNLDVKGIMYDPWNSQAVITELEEYDWPLIEVKQDYRNLSEPLKQFRLDVFEKKIMHNGNPNIEIAVNNAVRKHDNNGNIILDKKINRNKIDAIVAVTTAFTQAMYHEYTDNMEEYILSEDFGF